MITLAVWLVALVIVGAVYFLPGIIASKRQHRRADAIAVLNLLLGWSVLGWLVALVWALGDDVERPRVRRRYVVEYEDDDDGYEEPAPPPRRRAPPTRRPVR